MSDFSEGQDNPDTNINNFRYAVEGLAAGVLVHDMASDADYTLATTGDYPREWQNHVIKITDTGVVLTTGRNIIVPDNVRAYMFVNDTAQSLTLKRSAGTGIAVATGNWAMLYCDGTNVVRLTGDASTT
jgi:hypothetical protein